MQTRLAQPCLLCATRCQGDLLCPACLNDLPRLPPSRCPTCALPTPLGEICGRCLKQPPAFTATRAVYRYAFPLDALLQHFKYGHELALAGFFAERLTETLTPADCPDLLLPMPLHPRRLQERGFNQATEIARRLADRLDIPLALQACSRQLDTPPQAALPLKARRDNIRGAFACDRDLAGKRIALVDDVMTSGASLGELARTVLRAGAREVQAWVIARTLPR